MRGNLVTCLDCGWQGLPDRARTFERGPQGPRLMTCPHCCVAIELARVPSLADVEAATGVVATTYARMRSDVARGFDRVWRSLSPAEEVVLAVDAHGVFVARHRTHGTFRGATPADAIAGLAEVCRG